ncbi:coiled-coil domain-containing protein 138-like isoform X2 [Ptychodera flava]|uniref:coiled-coil domain-containing protein 138-like isoform X2 n=1 Tax=Ptychodera flava TaxID=63121 RepID=UPI00396A3A07
MNKFEVFVDGHRPHTVGYMYTRFALGIRIRQRNNYYVENARHTSLETATLDLPSAFRSTMYSGTPSKSSASRVSTISPSMALSSDERKHYNKALRELQKIVVLSSKKLELSENQIKRRLQKLKATGLEMSMDLDDILGSGSESETLTQNSEGLDGISPRLIKKYGKTLHHRRKIEDDFVDDTEGDLNDDLKKSESRKISVKEIHAELNSIHKKLQRESAVLHERELQLQEREQTLQQIEEASKVEQTALIRNAQQEVNRRWMILEEEHKAEIEQMEEILKNKIREAKRLKSSFDTTKQSNDSLKKQVAELKEKNKKLETQVDSVQSRLTNLQRKQEFADRHTDIENIPPPNLMKSKQSQKGLLESKPISTRKTKHSSAMYDVVTILMEWVSDIHLRPYCLQKPMQTPETLPSSILTQDRCIKILPSLVEILHSLPQGSYKMQLPLLQYIYWSIQTIEHEQSNQKTILTSTYRRLGEELYRPTLAKHVEIDNNPLDLAQSSNQSEKSIPNIFFKSADLSVRFLSSLIILKTLTQVDSLAHTFDVLKNDLKTDQAKELFMHYQGTSVILPFMRGINKALVSNAVDVFLQMSMESALLPQFLDSCCTEIWFRTCSSLLRTPNLNVKMLEKLSIILQKLSKYKLNKKYFEVYSIGKIVQEMQRTLGPDNPFLSLNLRSILFNLDSSKPVPSM